MRIKKPRKASIDEVRITREGEIAIIENADPSISVVRLTIGPNLRLMTNAAILDLFNDVIEAQQTMVAEYDAKLIEIPPGRPQIRYAEESDQWVPRGRGSSSASTAPETGGTSGMCQNLTRSLMLV